MIRQLPGPVPRSQNVIMTRHAQRLPMQAALFCALGLFGLSSAGAQASSVDVPKIEYTDFTLRNGLRVILHEDHSTPIVALELWYNAGGKFDPKGKSGLAHMFEHMMDEGTLNMPNGEYKRTIQSVGGYYNAATSQDWVRYWSQLPSNNLETGLWLEAERMANLSPTLDSVRFAREREAVHNENRLRIQAVAVNSGLDAVAGALFADAAYAIPLIGYPAELDAATADDLRRFYDTYYVPNNAVLVIVGDFRTADARRMVEKHFSPIPRGQAITMPVTTKPFHGEKRLVMEHPQNVRQLWVAWRGASSVSPDRPAMVALSSIITERLRQLLVNERRLATVMSPFTNNNFDLYDAGVFQVAVTPTPTASATEIERLVDSVVASVKAEGVTATEVRRWIGSYRIDALESMQADSSKAEKIADATLSRGNPLGYYDVLERAQHLTPEQVQAAAKKYLTGDRVVLSIVPPGKLDLISKPELPYVNLSRKAP
jgi:zinc protease